MVGDDPAGPRTARWPPQELLRLSSFEHSGDIIALGTYDPTTEQVISFEELVGSHGGLGGHQDDAFLAYPSTWTRADEPLLGAPAIHRQLRAWLATPSPG